MKPRTPWVCALILLAGCQADHTASSGTLAAMPDRGEANLAQIHLADRMASVRATFPHAFCKAITAQAITAQCVTGKVHYAGTDDAVLFVTLAADRVVVVQVYGLPPEHLPTVVREISSRWGPPDDAKHRPPQAGADGVSWSSRRWLMVAAPAREDRRFASVLLYDWDFVSTIQLGGIESMQPPR